MCYTYAMGCDAEAERVLAGAVKDCAAVLDVLRPVIQKVWSTNLDRTEGDLGDDGHTLGYDSYRNIGNLATPRLDRLEGVRASFATGTLEIRCAGRVLHLSKASSQSRDWVPRTMGWTKSDVFRRAATANSTAYRGQDGTLFEAQPADASALVHLHLIWQGRAGGVVRTWIGFPRREGPSWFALQDLGEAGSSSGTGTGTPSGPPKPAPAPASSFDALKEPDLAMGLRQAPDPEGGAGGADGKAARP